MARGPATRARVIVLDTTKLGETDLIVTFLAEDGSLARAVAKGARKPGSRFGGATRLYRSADALLAPGRSLSILTDARLTDDTPPVEETLEPMAACAAVAECLVATLSEGEADAIVFSLARSTFAAISRASDLPHLELVVAAFAFKLLAILGWRVEFESCVGCGSEDVHWFSPSAGGVLCSMCAPHAPDAELLGEHRRSWVRALLLCRYDELLAAAVSSADARELTRLAGLWIRSQLDVSAKAFAFFEGLS